MTENKTIAPASRLNVEALASFYRYGHRSVGIGPKHLHPAMPIIIPASSDLLQWLANNWKRHYGAYAEITCNGFLIFAMRRVTFFKLYALTSVSIN